MKISYCVEMQIWIVGTSSVLIHYFFFSNAHFLPWQTRLTEIHSLESLRGLRLQHLIGQCRPPHGSRNACAIIKAVQNRIQ